MLWAGRRYGWFLTRSAPLAGAVAALVLRVLEPDLPLYQATPFDPAEIQQLRNELSSSVAMGSLALAPFVGAAAAWFGWLLGIVIQREPEESSVASTRGASAVTATQALLLALAPIPARANASDPHHETMQVGPYTVLVGFSEWPMLAERSIDITFEPESDVFEPEGGIAGKTATIRVVDPLGEPYVVGPLGRHPRDRSLWGLDLIALPSSGPWSIELEIDGPLGIGSGTLEGIEVGARPGPPPAPFWILASLPLLFLVWLGVRGWRAVRPGRSPAAHAWR